MSKFEKAVYAGRLCAKHYALKDVHYREVDVFQYASLKSDYLVFREDVGDEAWQDLCIEWTWLERGKSSG